MANAQTSFELNRHSKRVPNTMTSKPAQVALCQREVKKVPKSPRRYRVTSLEKGRESRGSHAVSFVTKYVSANMASLPQRVFQDGGSRGRAGSMVTLIFPESILFPSLLLYSGVCTLAVASLIQQMFVNPSEPRPGTVTGSGDMPMNKTSAFITLIF